MSSCKPNKKPRRKWQPMAYPSKAAAAELFADISDNNATFDPEAYKSAGHRFIAIKATQGAAEIQPTWLRWVAGAHAVKLGVGHYHFADISQDAIGQAQHFWTMVRPHFAKGDRLIIDIEEGPQSLWPEWLRAFDIELHRLSGLWVIGYTFASALTPKLQLTGGKWWIASWGTAQPSAARRKLVNGELWAWQYTDGEVDPSGGPRAFAGIGECDGSVLSPPILELIERAER